MKNLKTNQLTGCLFGLLVTLLAAQAWAFDPVPGIRLDFPGTGSQTAVALPPGYSFLLTVWDEDGGAIGPRKYRYLVKEAVVDGTVINSAYFYNQYVDELVSFDDPQWSDWIDLNTGTEEPKRLTMPILPEGGFYICAVQVLDADGTVSMDRTYNQSVANFHVSEQFRPVILVFELFLGSFNNTWQSELASGQPLNFQLQASAAEYGGSIESFRYGWDVIDPDDPNDPGWAIPAGQAEETIVVPERVFTEGLHSLLVQAVDSYGFDHHYFGYLNVIPFVSIENQLPLLFVDQVVDHMSNRWPSEDNSVAYDHEDFRNEYWDFLAAAEGVADYNPQRDRRDHTQQVQYSEIVNYRSVLVTARFHTQQTMFNQFRAENGQDKYVWLGPYQAQGGNLFLVGDRSMESFLEPQNYMTPLIFDTSEEFFQMNNETYIVGFGLLVRPDGSSINRGATMYPYLTAGLSLLDWSVPVNKHVYGRMLPAHYDRRAECSGMKAMVLAEDFRSHHQINSLVIGDTLQTNRDIDWRDGNYNEPDTLLSNEFPFTGDEFIDENITSRPTFWQRQDCADGYDGYCVEPMFQGVSRFDYKRKVHWDAGDTDWPSNYYSDSELEEICGAMALTSLETPEGPIPNGTALTNDLTYGYLSYKNVADKPSGKADAYWGFDPYRFDPVESKKAVRWVLGYFGLPMNQ